MEGWLSNDIRKDQKGFGKRRLLIQADEEHMTRAPFISITQIVCGH
jgi:hypothetical protein